MKKYKFLLLITCLFIYRMVEAQNSKGITMSFEKESLVTVLQEINKQTGMGFTSTPECLTQAPPITIKAKNASLIDILNMICKGNPFTFYISHEIIILAPRPVRGRVIDQMNEPIADVKVQCGRTRVITNSRGEFYLRNEDCDNLIKFTYPGDTVIIRPPRTTYLTVRMKNPIASINN